MTELWRGVARSFSRQRAPPAETPRSRGIPFETCAAAIDERAIEAPLLASGQGSHCRVASFARQGFASRRSRPGRLVIGADQTLCLEGRVLGKPADRAAAAAQLAALSGRTHELYSGCCVARENTILFETVCVHGLAAGSFPRHSSKPIWTSRDSLLSSAGAISWRVSAFIYSMRSRATIRRS